jgi:glycosyltransferase involved in cell wall biosynthesis
MSYHANVSAALHLVQDIMPLVWRHKPSARVWVVGKDPPRAIRRLQAIDDRVEVTGTVPDLRPYLLGAMVAAVPAPYGAGIQNKVLEAMACGTPVVASPRALSSLNVADGRHALVAHCPAAFADAILSLMEDRALRRRLGHDARCYVEAYHDWRAIVKQLEAIYGELCGIRVHPQ